jgi:teichuronic acid exporter
MSLKKQATISFVWTFAQQFGNQLIGFVVSVILARLLLPEEFGLIGMIAVFIAIGNTLLHSGLTKSLIRGEDLDNEDYSTVFYFNLIASIILYIILFFLSPFIANFYEQPLLISILRVYCLTFIIQAFSAVQLARLTKTLNFKTQTMVALPSAIVGGIVGITMAFLGYGIWSLVWSSVLSSAVNSLQLWIYSKWKPDVCFNYNKFKLHFNYGYKLALSELLDRIFSNIFLIVIGKYFSPAQVGFYTRAETMKQLPVRNISNALDRVTFPLFVSIQNDDIRLKRVYKKLMKMVVFIITPVLVLLVILAEPIFVFLFTSKWIPAVPYFQILCISGILYPLHSYNLTVLNVKGRSDLFLKLEVLKKALVIISLIITIPLGIISMLIGQVVTSVIAFFINSHYTGKFIDYNALQQLRDVLPVFMLSVQIGISVLALDVYILGEYPDIIRIVVGSFIGFSMYLFIAYQLKFESFFELSKLLFKK